MVRCSTRHFELETRDFVVVSVAAVRCLKLRFLAL